jgi:hypothetical protein
MKQKAPKQEWHCPHDIARWKVVGPEHQLRCDVCKERLQREFDIGARDVGVALYRSTGYKPFDPRGWLA